MSNWCSNVLIVTGLKEVLKEFEEFAKSVPCKDSKVDLYIENDILDFYRFVPYPEEFLAIRRAIAELNDQIFNKLNGEESRIRLEESMKNLRESFYSASHTWYLAHWGTTTGPDTLEVHHDEEKLQYHFYTKWTPPIYVVLAMSRQFPKLNFQLAFWDRIAGFEGIYEFAGGKVVNEDWREGIFIEDLLEGTVRSMFQG